MLSVDGFDGSRNIRAFIFNLFVLFVWLWYYNLNKMNLFGLSFVLYFFKLSYGSNFWNLHVNCHVNGTFQSGLRFQTGLSSLRVPSCKRALRYMAVRRRHFQACRNKFNRTEFTLPQPQQANDRFILWIQLPFHLLGHHGSYLMTEYRKSNVNWP